MSNSITSRLFLIPNILSDESPDDFLAESVKRQVHHIRHFIVEQEKPARALIRKLQLETPQSELYLRLWNEHSTPEDLGFAVEMFAQGDVGLITDAGIPCVADPGSEIVAWAHSNQIRVIPLPGASSLFMALMASGMNGQSFAFQGYIPIDKSKRTSRIKAMIDLVLSANQTQIFMEAPYRNNALMADLVNLMPKGVKLCVASNITGENELIRTQSGAEWKKKLPDLHKKPTLFILGQ